jgi:uncharacterized protein (TIGR03437 family)
MPGISINGLPAPLLGTTASQINFQIPFEVGPGTATVNLLANGSSVGTSSIQVHSVAPGLFTQADGTAAVLNQDSSVNGAMNPAVSGTVVAAYLTGLGSVQPPVATGKPAPFDSLSTTTSGATATIGGATATVEFAGLAPGYTGLYQVNLLVPQLPGGRYPLQVSVNGVMSNGADVNIR